jgi:hypothetical protein
MVNAARPAKIQATVQNRAAVRANATLLLAWVFMVWVLHNLEACGKLARLAGEGISMSERFPGL